MVARLQRRAAMGRRLHVLRTLTCSKSVQRKSVIMDALLYIYKLKLKLEAIKRELANLVAIKREYLSLMKQLQLPKEVKVEKAEQGLLVRVTCEKGGDKLVSILEVFEEMGLVILNARVSSNLFFAMEAIVVADQEQHALHVKSITQAVTKAIERQ
uniref:Plant bHLH transcription factor ACT-like domain-containing protein n=1 Tax=Populus trichocarpa TaxID=3694 RepID=A0A3N7EZG3_POPTR